jgi:acyl carrier protein
MVKHIGEYLEHDVPDLRPDSPLRSAVPGLDSLKVFEMLLYLEECFGVEFEENLLSRIQTAGDLADVIENRIAEKAQRAV